MKPITLRQHEVIHLSDTGSVIAWRVVKPGSLLSESDGAKRRVLHLPHDLEVLNGFLSQRQKDPCKRFCKFGQTGEERFVKETGYWIQEKGHPCVTYRAYGDRKPSGCSWMPSTHMPRWASRFTVTLDVGVKRIQEVTEEEGYGSGYKRAASFYVELDRRGSCAQLARLTGRPPTSPAAAFVRDLANESNPGSWSRNDYFWKITCTLTK